jgi:zinc D-Ala-D-Ala carboxypeptidase
MERISEHITYSEAVCSDTAKRLGIDNTPNGGQIERMKTLAYKVFEPLRLHLGVPIYISSFFRSAALNKAIKGAKNSQHLTGEAMDIDAEKYGGTTNKTIFEFIKNNLEFDQLLWEMGTDTEPDWVHVSFTYKHPNRKEVLKAFKGSNGTQYAPYV